MVKYPFMSSHNSLMAAIRSQAGKPVPFYYEESCEHCDKSFATPVECGIHEASCKAKIFEYVKQYKMKKQNVKETGKEIPCHICGCKGHITCPVTKFIDSP